MTNQLSLKQEIAELKEIAKSNWYDGDQLAKKSLKIIRSLQKVIKIQEEGFKKISKYSCNYTAVSEISQDIQRKTEQLLSQ